MLPAKPGSRRNMFLARASVQMRNMIIISREAECRGIFPYAFFTNQMV